MLNDLEMYCCHLDIILKGMIIRFKDFHELKVPSWMIYIFEMKVDCVIQLFRNH